jgi:Zinc carboxypeptidase.
MLARLAMRYKKDQDIYFHRELLIRSPQDRNIDLITISSHDGKLEIQESFIHESLFPMRDWEPRAFKFRQNKPIVLLTARVHPGETPASHSMNGVIKFLLDK